MPSLMSLRGSRLIAASLVSLLLSAGAAAAAATACFTPDEDCTAKVTAAVDAAATQILVQSSAARLPGLLEALQRAKDRGVDVRILVGRTPNDGPDPGLTALAAKGVLVAVDNTPSAGTANAVIVDRATVILGSGSLGRPAQDKSSGYTLFVADDPALATAYAANWDRRAGQAHPLAP